MWKSWVFVLVCSGWLVGRAEAQMRLLGVEPQPALNECGRLGEPGERPRDRRLALREDQPVFPIGLPKVRAVDGDYVLIATVVPAGRAGEYACSVRLECSSKGAEEVLRSVTFATSSGQAPTSTRANPRGALFTGLRGPLEASAHLTRAPRLRSMELPFGTRKNTLTVRLQPPAELAPAPSWLSVTATPADDAYSVQLAGPIQELNRVRGFALRVDTDLPYVEAEDGPCGVRITRTQSHVGQLAGARLTAFVVLADRSLCTVSTTLPALTASGLP